MRITFEKASEIYDVTTIGEQDWAAFKDYYSSLSKPEHFVDAQRDVASPSAWKQVLIDGNSGGRTLFGVWHKETMIGMTGLIVSDAHDPRDSVAVMTTSELADSYRGQGLSSLLYDARKQHLDDIRFQGIVETYIAFDNTASIRAAEKNGFELQNDRITPVYDVYVLRDDARKLSL